MRRRFFVDKFEATSASLQGEPAEHLGRVLRAEQGQVYELSDGQRVWLGRIERVELKRRGDSRIEFALVRPLAARESPLEIHLLISLVKFDRFEWCLEKATELGATSIVPLAAARTDKPLVAAAVKRQERWQKIVLESAQQSRRMRPPSLRDAITPAEAFADCAAPCKILLSERPNIPPIRAALKNAEGIPAAALAFGPEGGWVDAELEAARSGGFVEASLGENILRAETAVAASLAILRYAAGA